MTLHRRPSERMLTPDQGLIILGCSRRKVVTSAPIPALELYQGGCVPRCREHLVTDATRRARIRIVSAAHGLLRAEDPISTYEDRLATRADALRLHEWTVSRQLDVELAETPALRHLLIIVEPMYLLALQRVFDHLDRLNQIVIIPSARAWQDGLAYLRCWGWA